MVKTSGKKGVKKDKADADVPEMKDRRTYFVVARGNMDNTADARKMNDINVVMKFVQSVMGGYVHVGNNTIFLALPSFTGDVAWVEKNVMRSVDIQRAHNEESAVTIAKALRARLDTFGDTGTDKVGTGIVQYYLESMYMKYDTWSD